MEVGLATQFRTLVYHDTKRRLGSIWFKRYPPILLDSMERNDQAITCFQFWHTWSSL